MTAAAATTAAPVVTAFHELTGHAPGATWWAPGRVNLIGEHTDYNDGLALPLAVGRGTVVAAGLRADGLARCVSLDRPGEDAVVAIDDAGSDRVPGWAAYVVGVVRALDRAGVAVPGVDVVVGSGLPLGAGLASSAALEVATAMAVLALADVSLDPLTVVRACQAAEHELAGAPTGLMDQLAVLQGVRGNALLIDSRALSTQPVVFDLRRWGAALLVIDTGVHHSNSGPGYAERRRECELAARSLGLASLRDAGMAAVEERLQGTLRRRARHVVTENGRVEAVARVLRERGDIADLGRVLLAGHASLRDDFEVSCVELDVAVEAALAGGAHGARMTGGGFGGCALALAPAAACDEVGDAVASAFARRGLTAPVVFTVEACDGARAVG